MGVGPQGPQGPPGDRGQSGESVMVDQIQVTNILSNQNALLNRLSSNVVNNTNVMNSISEQILKSPDTISNKLAENVNFRNNIGDNIIQNSTIIGEKIADSIISDKDNIINLSSSFSSQGSLIDDLAYTLSNPTLPYAKYLQGEPGSITTIKTSIKPFTMLCDTTGNCNTPKTDFYLNFTNGNLIFNNKDKSPSFRVSSDGGPWIAGNKGGILGTYNDNLNVGTVAVKWDAQGNVSVSDLAKTTGSLRVGGDMYLKHLYASGFLTAINTININTTDGSSYVEGLFHVGTPGYHKGLTGITDGSTFNITKNGPYRNTNGGKDTVLLNNYNNPYILGDTTTSGSIYMLNNNENIGEGWSKGITGSTTGLKNNAAIINVTDKMEGMKGSLMLIGNAAGDNTNRIVSIKDKLRIGSWILSETPEGRFEIKNINEPNNKITIDDVLDTPANRINNTFIRGSTVGSNIFNNGDITCANLTGTNLISTTLNASEYISQNDFNVSNVNISNEFKADGGGTDFKGKLTVDSIRGNHLNGRGDISVKSVNCRGDAYINHSIYSRNDTIWLRVPNVRGTGRLTKFNNQNWLCEILDSGESGKRSCKPSIQK